MSSDSGPDCAASDQQCGECVLASGGGIAPTRRALVAIDDPAYWPIWLNAFTEIGFSSTFGKINFWCAGGEHFDIVQIHWPEYLSIWPVTGMADIRTIVERIHEWRAMGTLVVGSINNLHPHAADTSLNAELYRHVYGACDVLQHFSEYSLAAINARYPELARTVRAVVTLPGLYDHLRPQADQPLARCADSPLGRAAGDFSIGLFGALRSSQEWQLAYAGFLTARVPKKKLVVLSRFAPKGNRWSRTVQNVTFAACTKVVASYSSNRFVPDAELGETLGRLDCLVVPRVDAMSSALPLLGMTLGIPTVAPRHGAMPEYLAGTANELYEPGSHRSLARAIERISRRDPEEVKASNKAVASKRSWSAGLLQVLTQAHQ